MPEKDENKMKAKEEKIDQYLEMCSTINAISSVLGRMVGACKRLYAYGDSSVAAQQARAIENAGWYIANTAITMREMCEELEREK